MKDTPKYVHDCDHCHFIATIGGLDVYTHTYTREGSTPSIIARFGDEGAEYTSMPLSYFRKLIADNGPIQIGGFEKRCQGSAPRVPLRPKLRHGI